ncbi:MAG TPA: ABC transporter ATP-binding protein [Gaiellaceae bacterium]|nr:ABC transporter ATP-binding protein [Gaiellaceae bacterium]
MSSGVAVQSGEIRGRALGRVFKIRLTQSRSLKETILRRELPRTRELWALRDVDLDIHRGETVGIVGRNGSGKSTLLKLIAGIFSPSTGTLEVEGRVGSLIEIGAGFHPEFTGVENVYLNAAIYGLKRSYVDEHLDEIIDFAELEQFKDVPVRTYSSGMYMRLGFSVAMHVQPDILLLDEVLAVGDEAFQQKCFGRIGDFKRAGGTIVFVSHDPSAVERLCDRAIMLEAGRVIEQGAAADVVSAYHRRVVTGPAERAVRDGGAVAGRCRVHEVRAIAGDGTARDRFVEGEPMALEVWLYAEEEVAGASVTVGMRDADGRPVGSQTLDDVRLPPGRLERLRLNFPGLPMREGRFFVDVGVTTADRDAELALAERALELSVFGSDAAGSGPIRLGGTWELPSADGAGDG